MVKTWVKRSLRQPARSEMRFVRPKKPAAAIVSAVLMICSGRSSDRFRGGTAVVVEAAEMCQHYFSKIIKKIVGALELRISQRRCSWDRLVPP